MKLWTPLGLLLSTLLLTACATKNGVQLDTDHHLTSPQAQQTSSATRDIPAPVQQGYSLPPPRSQAKPETYSVVVNNVRVQDLLFSLARDAKVNVDIHPGLTGTVTLNALDQTLPQLLSRISKQVDMRFEFDGDNLTVMPDSPFLRTYRIDYVNMSRDTSGTVAVSSQIATAGTSGVGSNSSNSGSGTTGNSSNTLITNTARNHFWDTLIQNMKDLLRETDKIFPDGAAEKTVETTTQGGTTTTSVRASKPDDLLSRSADTEKKSTQVEKTVTFREAASIIANPEAGVVSIRATARQHEKVQEFLSQVMNSARRQVLIEATIAEVELSQNYQQGVDWRALNVFDTGARIIQSAVGGITGPSSTLLEVGYDSSGGNFKSSLKFLESFGNVKVLSSPKVSVLNNQTAVLKVVDNVVYFTVEQNLVRGNGTTTQDLATFTSTIHTVPIGLVMNVTPQIGESNSILLNIRPTLSRTVGDGAIDPNPDLKREGIVNRIPIVRSREIESILRVNSGNIAVMGGLMEDLLNNTDDTVPGLSRSPIFGGLFENRNDTKRKTELVIFIRPTVIREGDTNVDISDLPGSTFFNTPRGMPGPATLGGGR
ncbi:MAG: MSHA-type pilus biosis protein MshL [Rhodocyclales bacterium]|nr:MSHA-type pilus biosis protein MshL [Rhodocyclales bacterium]